MYGAKNGHSISGITLETFLYNEDVFFSISSFQDTPISSRILLGCNWLVLLSTDLSIIIGLNL